jgi:hypothetical protein
MRGITHELVGVGNLRSSKSGGKVTLDGLSNLARLLADNVDAVLSLLGSLRSERSSALADSGGGGLDLVERAVGHLLLLRGGGEVGGGGVTDLADLLSGGVGEVGSGGGDGNLRGGGGRLGSRERLGSRLNLLAGASRLDPSETSGDGGLISRGEDGEGRDVSRHTRASESGRDKGLGVVESAVGGVGETTGNGGSRLESGLSESRRSSILSRGGLDGDFGFAASAAEEA